MKQFRILVLVCAAAAAGHGETVINGSRRILGTWDASQAAATKAARQSASDPVTCAEGEIYYNSTLHKHRQCTAANTWSDLGGGGGPITSYVQYAAAKCQAGVPVANFSLPAANAPSAVCVTGGSVVAGALQFTGSSGTAQSVQDHFELPPDWTGAIDVELAFRSQDSTNPATATIQAACVGNGDIGNPQFSAFVTAPVLAAASNGRTVAKVQSIETQACAAGAEYYWKLTVDTGAMQSALELLSARFTIRRSN